MSSPSIHSRKADLAQFSPEVQRGLDQMARAVDYAHDLDSPVWDFAVEIERLFSVGMTTSDLRWLVKRGYVNHAREITAPQDTDRRFDPAEQNLTFGKSTCFVLSEAGLAILGREQSELNSAVVEMPRGIGRNGYAESVGHSLTLGPTGSEADSLIDLPSRELAAQRLQPAMIPNWDKDSRTFLVGEHLVKRFRVPSPNQEAVLDAFQEEGWPTSIDDPLSPVPDQQPKHRLRDTIKCLNLNQAARMIRFRGDGTGQRVLWELLAESVSHTDSTEKQSQRRAA